MSNKALLSFRVAGVQEFINSARTTEDFWVSSCLIAYLSREAARRLVETATDAPIPVFPAELPGSAPPTSEEVMSFPNGILVIVDRDQAATLGEVMESRFRHAWDEIVGSVEKQFPFLQGGAKGLWQRQKSYRCFETYWAWAPYDGADYQKSFRDVSRLMESRKTLRNFGPSEAEHIKCTLCGKYQSLQEHSKYDYSESRQYWDKIARAERRLLHRFRSGERLCLICTTCRLAGRLHEPIRKFRGGWYPSTSWIAVEPYRLKWMDAMRESGKENEAFCGALGDLLDYLGQKGSPREGLIERIDGDWFFPSTYRRKYILKEMDASEGGIDISKLDEKIKNTLGKLKQARGRYRLEDPPNYVALIAADGDQIGDRIADCKDPESHRELSRQLGSMAMKVRDSLQRMGGHLIYGGGDDLLALAPVQGLAGMLAEWRKKIAEDEPEGFGISAAVLILPHNDSLSGAIREAERLLRSQAKDRFRRGKVVFCVRRGSGQQTVAALPWVVKENDALTALQRLVDMMGEDREISPRFISHFGQLAPVLVEHRSIRDSADLAGYYLERATKERSFPEAKALLQRLSDAAHEVAGEEEHKEKEGKLSPHHLANVLLLARFLNRMVVVRTPVKEAAAK